MRPKGERRLRRVRRINGRVLRPAEEAQEAVLRSEEAPQEADVMRPTEEAPQAVVRSQEEAKESGKTVRQVLELQMRQILPALNELPTPRNLRAAEPRRSRDGLTADATHILRP